MKTKHIQMKTKLFALITLFLISLSVSAQIDRSKQPKPGPAPKISLEVPGEFQLKNGLTVLVVENHKLPRVSYTLTLDNPPIIEGDKAGVASLLSAMLGNGTTSIPKDDFNEEVDFLGARLNFGSQNAYASALSKYADRILQLMADAAINPLLTEEEFQKERDKLLEGLKAQEKNVNAVASRAGQALSYGVKHPYGEFMTEETVNNVTLENVRAFYQTNFTPNNAYLVVVGDTDLKTVKKQVKDYFGSWEKSIDVSNPVPEPNPNVQYTQINFVDMPNAVQSNISLTNTVDLEMSNPDYHAVLIANFILGGGTLNNYLNMNLRETHGYTYGSFSAIGTDKYASRFRAVAEVRNTVTDSAVVEILNEVNRIKTELVDADQLKNAKAKYVGSFVMNVEKPETVARYALNSKTEGLPADFYTTYLEKINAVTAEDVKRVANKYFKSQNARIIVVGKGSDVTGNLEKTGIPVMYFDKYANATEKPEFSKPIPDGVTAQTVIDGYITAIGGTDNAKAVKTILMNADVTIEGAPFAPKAEIKIMSPNKESMEMTVEGMGVLIKQKFDGTKGYAEQMGQKKEMTAEEIAVKKGENSIFPELYYDASKISLESITSIDGKDVYKVKVANDKSPIFRYYEVETGLLARVETTVEAQGQSFTSTVNYSEYSPVGNVKLPYNQAMKTGPQTILMNFTNVKINEGVTAEDFN
jgi:predicted Zn-dependent peptidase